MQLGRRCLPRSGMIVNFGIDANDCTQVLLPPTWTRDLCRQNCRTAIILKNIYFEIRGVVALTTPINAPPIHNAMKKPAIVPSQTYNGGYYWRVADGLRCTYLDPQLPKELLVRQSSAGSPFDGLTLFVDLFLFVAHFGDGRCLCALGA
jgi:hypothetical protein